MCSYFVLTFIHSTLHLYSTCVTHRCNINISNLFISLFASSTVNLYLIFYNIHIILYVKFVPEVCIMSLILNTGCFHCLILKTTLSTLSNFPLYCRRTVNWTKMKTLRWSCVQMIFCFLLFCHLFTVWLFAYFTVVVSEGFVAAKKLLCGASSLSNFQLSYFQHFHLCKCSQFIFADFIMYGQFLEFLTFKIIEKISKNLI